MPSRHCTAAALALVSLAMLGPAAAQSGDAGPRDKAEDPFRPTLPTDPDVERLLRRAETFMQRQQWSDALDMMQRVLEGRTDLDAPDTSSHTHAVISSDDRLFLPIRHLCHVAMRALPPEAIAIHRTVHEVAAEKAYAAAYEARDPTALALVFERWMLTRSAGRALLAAADVFLDLGRLQAAETAYRRLRTVWPESLQRDAGIADNWLAFKIAVCGSLRTGATPPWLHGSLTIEGTDVDQDEIGRRLRQLAVGRSVQTTEVKSTTTRLGLPKSSLIPLWQHRFEDGKPYRPLRRESGSPGALEPGPGRRGFAPVPRVTSFQPGGWPTFVDGGIAFMEHNRVHLHDALTGRAGSVFDGKAVARQPRHTEPRMRIPAYDDLTMRPVFDDQRLFVVRFPTNPRAGMDLILTNELVALDRRTGQKLWSEHSRQDSMSDRPPTTFLSAPLVARGNVFVLVRRDDKVLMAVRDASTGDEIRTIALHSGGTPLARPLAVPPVFHEPTNQVVALTNAGVLAAIDTGTLSLTWIRRYERNHPLRDTQPIRQVPYATSTIRQSPRGIRYLDPPGFAPSDLLISGSGIILAPTDGNVLLCVDVATGATKWMLSRRDLVRPVGLSLDEQTLFARAPDRIEAIDASSGVRRWQVPLPGLGLWNGRGTVVADGVLLPAPRHLLLIPITDGDRPDPSDIHTLDIPQFGYGQDPLDGPMNVSSDGAWVVLTRQGGVQVFSTQHALRAVAKTSDPVAEAAFLVQAGDLPDAIESWIRALSKADLPADIMRRTERQLLVVVRELAIAMAIGGGRDEALELLQRCRQALRTNRYLDRWHLARLDVFEALGDADAMQIERGILEELAARPEAGEKK